MDMKKNRLVIFMVFIAFFSVSSANAAEGGAHTASSFITLDADNIELKDVLRSIAEQSKASFIASEDIQAKKINLSFNHLSLDEALQSIALVNGLEYQRKENGVILVYSASGASFVSGMAPGGASLSSYGGQKTETRIYHLKYARLSNSPIDVGGNGTIKDLVSLQSASIESSGSRSSSSGSSASSTTSSNSSSATPANLVVERGIDRVIASLLTPAGKLTGDIQSNSLIITDVPSKLDDIEKVLAQIDLPTPQVLIEVYLMEIKKDILTNHGVDWGGEDGAIASFTGGSRTTGFPFTESFLNSSKGVKATTQGTSTLTLGTLSATSFQATLHFLTQDISTKVLARPRVLTMSNEAANIKLVTNAAIANQTSLTTADGQSTSTANSAERSQVGITLKMTPQVNADETVGLFLEPSITTVAVSSFFPTIFLDPTTRVVRTVTRVKNHETLVIGGLMERNGSKDGKRIPFLGSVPLVGKAFSYDNNSDSDRELIIFITPHIVHTYNTFSQKNAMSPMGQKDTSIQKVLSEFRDSEMISELDVAEARGIKNDLKVKEKKMRTPLPPEGNRGIL